MIKMTKLTEVFVDYARTGKFPVVNFANNSSLQEVIHRLDSGFTEFPATYTGDQIVEDILEHVEKAQSDEYVGIKGFTVLDSIAKTMSDRISVSRSYINDLKTQVASMRKIIDEQYDQQLKREGVGVVSLNLTTPTGTYPVLKWNSTNKVAPLKFIITELHESARIEQDVITRMTVGPVYNMLINTLPIKFKEFSDVTLDKDSVAELKDYIKVKTDLVDDDIAKYVKILTQTSSAKSFCKKIINLLKISSNCGNSVVYAINTIDDLIKLTDIIDKGTIPSKDAIQKNLYVINYYLNPLVYFLTLARTIICKDALLLDNKMLNNDNVTDMERAGITETDITTHLHYMNSSPNLPFSGIALATVVSFKPHLTERRKKDQDKSELSVKFQTNAVKRKVVTSVLTKYVDDTFNKDDLKFDVNIKSKISRVCDSMLLSDINLDDILFKFLLDIVKGHEFTELLYNKLGASYMNTITVKNNLSDEDIVIAETGVFVKIVIEFILNSFCKN